MGFELVMKAHSHVTEKYLEYLQKKPYLKVLHECGREGVEALQRATPKDTGLTAASWSYEIVTKPGTTQLFWKNDNVTKDGDPIAIMLQYGHGTGTGGYVHGRDYINPAIRPVFDRITDRVWEAMREQ